MHWGTQYRKTVEAPSYIRRPNLVSAFGVMNNLTCTIHIVCLGLSRHLPWDFQVTHIPHCLPWVSQCVISPRPHIFCLTVLGASLGTHLTHCKNLVLFYPGPQTACIFSSFPQGEPTFDTFTLIRNHWDNLHCMQS